MNSVPNFEEDDMFHISKDDQEVNRILSKNKLPVFSTISLRTFKRNIRAKVMRRKLVK